MIRVAVWIDCETEFNCAYVPLPESELDAAASTYQMLTAAVEQQVLTSSRGSALLEVGYLDVGYLHRPVDRRWLRQRLKEAV